MDENICKFNPDKKALPTTTRCLIPEEKHLLELNYNNLHQTLWESHKISWVVTGLYLPIIFTAQGLIIKMFFEKTSDFQNINFFVIIGAIGIITLTFIWWLILRMFSRFNESRLKRLKRIEKILSDNEITNKDVLIKQYSLDYATDFKISRKCRFSRLFKPLLKTPESNVSVPTADFSVDTKAGNPPLCVHFTNESDNYTFIEWDFENCGKIDSIEERPSYTYNEIGNYTAKLNAYNENGYSSMERKIKLLDPDHYCFLKINFDTLYTRILYIILLVNLTLIWFAGSFIL